MNNGLFANYVIRVTGPGMDWQMMITDEKDLEAMDAILRRVRRHVDAINKEIGRMNPDTLTLAEEAKPV